MNRDQLTTARAPVPIELPSIGTAFVRVPTARDAIEAEGRDVPWFVARFLCREDGSPWFREGEAAAGDVPAWVATAVVERVAELMKPPQQPGQACAPTLGRETGLEYRANGNADGGGTRGMAAA